MIMHNLSHSAGQQRTHTVLGIANADPNLDRGPDALPLGSTSCTRSKPVQLDISSFSVHNRELSWFPSFPLLPPAPSLSRLHLVSSQDGAT